MTMPTVYTKLRIPLSEQRAPYLVPLPRVVSRTPFPSLRPPEAAATLGSYSALCRHAPEHSARPTLPSVDPAPATPRSWGSAVTNVELSRAPSPTWPVLFQTSCGETQFLAPGLRRSSVLRCSACTGTTTPCPRGHLGVVQQRPSASNATAWRSGWVERTGESRRGRNWRIS